MLNSKQLSNQEIKEAFNDIQKCKFKFNEVNYQNICTSNLKLLEDLSLRKKELYNYEYLFRNPTIKIQEIKNFFKKIVKSNVFNEACKILYGKEFIKIFKDDSILDGYFEKYLKFVPYKSSQSSGFTDKSSLKTYLFLKKKLIYVGIEDRKFKKLIKEALRNGSYITVFVHEINHFIYSFLFISDNTSSLSFQTPRKNKISDDLREGGFYFEFLLFGKIINQLSLKECLYLLNSKNYEKTLKDFQKGFMKLQASDLNTNGYFGKYNILNKNIEKYTNCSIVNKNYNIDLLNENFINFSNNNCTCIHRKINYEKIKKYFVKK